MLEKIDQLLVKTVKATAIKAATAMVAFCPSTSYTGKMVSTTAIKAAVPLVNEREWERSATFPTQQPAPSTTAGRVRWWKPQ